jgi:cysteinyl-tRNA synthetase
MHNGMLQMGEEKMAKSVGNIELLGEVLQRWGRDAVILFFVSGHYRQPLRFADESMIQAQAGVKRLREAGRRLVTGPSPQDLGKHRERFFEALADDFNTPRALAQVWEWVGEANKREDVGDSDLREMLQVIGLDNLLDADALGDAPDDAALELLARREQARAEKDWDTADRIRDELAALGWEVRDGSGGAALVRA